MSPTCSLPCGHSSVSVSGKRISAERTTYAKGVAAALMRTGRLLEASVYVQLWWDWAEQVPARSYAAFAQGFGTSEFLIRQAFRYLEEQGWVQREEVREGRLRYRITLEIGTYNPSPPTDCTCKFSGVKNCTCDFSGVTFHRLWAFPSQIDELEQNAVSECYIRTSESGTELALTTTATTTAAVVTAVKNYSVETPEILSGATEIEVGDKSHKSADTGVGEGSAESAAPEVPPTIAPVKKRVRTKKPKAVKVLESVSASQEFRTLTLPEIQRDTWWGAIQTLHEAWCTGLGKQYALNTWRYAAWRFALVENGYTVEQLESAIPGVRARDWWRDHCSDPHVMFAKNPSKIEQFFPVNRAVTHDRFGVGAAVPTEGFEF